MRKLIFFLAAPLAFATSPAIAQQAAATTATQPAPNAAPSHASSSAHQMNSIDDIVGAHYPAGCAFAGSTYNGPRYAADSITVRCGTQEQFTAGYNLSPALLPTCRLTANGYVCRITLASPAH